MDKNQVINKYKQLYYEEAYLGSFKAFENALIKQKTTDKQFFIFLSKHFDYYEKNLYNQPFEKIRKVSLLISYHIYKKEKINSFHKAIIIKDLKEFRILLVMYYIYRLMILINYI